MKLKLLNFKNFLFFSIFLWPLVPRGEGMSIKIEGIVVDAPQLISISLIGVWIFKRFLNRITINMDADIRINKVAIFLFFLATIQLLSVLVSEDWLTSLRMWFVNVFTCYFIFFIVLNEIKSLDECNKVLNLIIYASLILAAAIWYEHLFGVNLFDKIRGTLGSLPYWSDPDKATRGPFGGKIITAQYFSLVVFLLLPRVLAASSPRNIVIWATAFFFVLMALFFTLTRVAIIGVALVLFLSMFLNLKGFHVRKSVKIILLILFFGTIATSVTPQFFEPNIVRNRFAILQRLNDSSDGSVSGHIFSLKAIMPAFLKLDRFILGYGPGVVGKYNMIGSEMVEAGGLDFVYGWTFTLYHVFILESGIFAIVLFVLIIWFSAYPLYKIISREQYDSKRKMLSYGLLLAFASYALAILGGHFKDTLFLFFALLGIVPNVTGNKALLLKLKL